MEVKAKARYIRMSPRKVRLVVDLIRGLNVQDAKAQLSFSKKAAAEPVLKLLNSAIANATNNFNMNANDLYVKTIMVDGGPILKRWRPRAFGRAGAIRKRTSHINIALASRAEQKKETAKASNSSKAN
jgi:large subunit ribosomal protein L22